MLDVVVRGHKPTVTRQSPPARNFSGAKPVKWPRWPSRKKMRTSRRG
jgi:hypothetical protein